MKKTIRHLLNSPVWLFVWPFAILVLLFIFFTNRKTCCHQNGSSLSKFPSQGTGQPRRIKIDYADDIDDSEDTIPTGRVENEGDEVNSGTGSVIGTDISGVRLDRIREIIENRGKVSVPDLSAEFPGVTERTLRRDMDKLVSRGLAKKHGSTRSTVYVRA